MLLTSPHSVHPLSCVSGGSEFRKNEGSLLRVQSGACAVSLNEEARLSWERKVRCKGDALWYIRNYMEGDMREVRGGRGIVSASVYLKLWRIKRIIADEFNRILET